MVVASVTTTAPANAWCAGISGINLGSGCSSTLGNFALGLGEGAEAHSDGLLTGAIAVGDSFAETAGVLTAAWAAGTGSYAFTDGTLSWAMAQGEGLIAGAGNARDFANFAFSFGNAGQAAFSWVTAGAGNFNLAANLGGSGSMEVVAGGGSGNSAINILSDRNRVRSGRGFLNSAWQVGNPFTQRTGIDNVYAEGGNLLTAFNLRPLLFTEFCDSQVCGNSVYASGGPFSIAGAIGLAERFVEQNGPGIKINTPFNPPSTNVLAAPAVLSESVSEANAAGAASLKSVRDNVKAVKKRMDSDFAASAAKAAKAAKKQNGLLRSNLKSSLKSVRDEITKSTKKFNDAVSKATAKRAKKAKAGE
jgi:hypothetical protein